jgi:hypothetical protein
MGIMDGHMRMSESRDVGLGSWHGEEEKADTGHIHWLFDFDKN